MKYAFILGRLSSLSIAEILAMMEKLKIKYSIKSASQKMLILDVEKEVGFKEILKTMGGTIKILEIGNWKLEIPILGRVRDGLFPLCERGSGGFSEISSDIQNIIKHLTLEKVKQLNNKIIIGYSVYSANKIEKSEFNQFLKSIKKNLIALKKELRKEKITCRIITPKDYETGLSSASIVNNKILERGIDLNFILMKNPPSPLLQKGKSQEGNIQITLGKTIAIQDIESYSRRDYERPRREAKIGMMPPKLAQIMLNLARVKKDQLILDPFCGTGVILQEALLMGCGIIGSDANEKQVQNTKANLKWLKENYLSLPQNFPLYKRGQGGFSEKNFSISKIDAMHLAKKIKILSIDNIITETTLGPIYLKTPAPKEIRKNFKKLEKIYLKFLVQAKKVLKPGGKIAMTVPCYQIGRNKFILMPIVDIFKKTGYSVKEPLPKDILDGLGSTPDITSRNTLIYSRPNQIVGREIFILE